MLQKCMGEGKDIQRVLYEWRNLPRQHGYSPAQLMFGRSQQLLLPQPASAFQPIDYSDAAAKLDKKFFSSLPHYDRDKVQLSSLYPGEAVFIQCEKTKKWEKKGKVLEKRPDGLSYLVDIDGKLAVRSRFFLKPVLQVGQGAVKDDQVQDQGEFHSSSTPPLRRSSRLEKKISELEQCCLSCAPAPAIPTQRSSGNLSVCSECTGRIPKRRPSTSPRVDSPSSTLSGLHLPLGQPPSSSARCFSWPSSSVAGSVPGVSARAGTVMDSSSLSFGPLPTVLPDPRWSPPSPASPPVPHGNLAPRLHLPCHTPTLRGGSGPPQAGPPFPRPTPLMTGSTPGCLTRSFPPFSTKVVTSTTPSASVGCLDAPGLPSSTVPGHTSTMIAGRIPAASSSWTPLPGRVEPLPRVGPSVLRSHQSLPSGSPSQLSAIGPSGPSPARPLGHRLPVPEGTPCQLSRSTTALTPLMSSSSTSRRPPGQGFLLMPPCEEGRIVPSATVRDYNRLSSDRPGSVFGLKVHF